MARDPGERRSVRQSQIAVQEHETLVCPRCESTNTKFCYYNNYNLSQPRYFCRSCRRYWTHGGSLRNIPVGGGSRAKRSRTTASSPSSSSSSSSSASLSVSPATISASDITANLSFKGGSFMSLLGTPAPPGFLGLGEPVLDRDGIEGFELVDDGARNGMDTWQVGSGDGGDCFGWPDFSRKAFSSG